MQYFGDYDIVRILEKMEFVFQKLNIEEFKESAEQHNILITSIDNDAELSASLSLINKSLTITLPSTIKLVAAYIRNNADEFVQYID